MSTTMYTSRIFLDSGDPKDTKQALKILGNLDGQTTNPTLVAKSSQVQEWIASGRRFTPAELMDMYKDMVQEIAALIPQGSVSIEVYADRDTTAEDMLNQANQMNLWIPNAHIKFPTYTPGLEAAAAFAKQGGRVNMTLCFSQAQAMAVHLALHPSHRGQVFYSSFIGRVYDAGQSGLDLLNNTLKLYQEHDSKVDVLACSFRNYQQFLASLQAGCHIITAPLTYLQTWKEQGCPIPDKEQIILVEESHIQPVAMKSFDRSLSWSELDINHPKTLEGIDKFVADWKSLTK